MPIELPEDRVYYHPSPNETDELSCWVPGSQVKPLVRARVLSPELAAAHPRGFEFPVDKTSLVDLGIRLAASPQRLLDAFRYVRELRKLPASAEVPASIVEQAAGRMKRFHEVDEPADLLRRDMLRIAPPRKLVVRRSTGDTVDTVFNRLLTARKGD